MNGERIEIDGKTYDLSDPEERKAAIRAWLKSKSRERQKSVLEETRRETTSEREEKRDE